MPPSYREDGRRLEAVSKRMLKSSLSCLRTGYTPVSVYEGSHLSTPRPLLSAWNEVREVRWYRESNLSS